MSRVTLWVSAAFDLRDLSFAFDPYDNVDAIRVSDDAMARVFAEARFCDSKCRSRGCTILQFAQFLPKIYTMCTCVKQYESRLVCKYESSNRHGLVTLTH